jgi:4-carboxymuconolactone decarboxylase
VQAVSEARRTILLTAALGLGAALAGPAFGQEPRPMADAQALATKQQATAPITAAAAVGDMPRLNAALGQGLDAGLTAEQLRQLVDVLARRGWPEAAQRAREALQRTLADAAKR